ncbi:hypothetical protein DIPPA_08952 [Diplonema papillatum]|nr:hypothetical protein DIPPA_08952 [Diplonema papillatum]
MRHHYALARCGLLVFAAGVAKCETCYNVEVAKRVSADDCIHGCCTDGYCGTEKECTESLITVVVIAALVVFVVCVVGCCAFMRLHDLGPFSQSIGPERLIAARPPTLPPPSPRELPVAAPGNYAYKIPYDLQASGSMQSAVSLRPQVSFQSVSTQPTPITPYVSSVPTPITPYLEPHYYTR